ncbi:S1/P1 nuclease [Aurantivibrio infirmus]
MGLEIQAVPSFEMRLFMKFLGLVFLFLLSGQAGAFSSAGHSIICEIAFQTLTNEAKAEVRVLLEETPYSSFSAACSWADHIRSNKYYDFAKPHHYINVSRGAGSVGTSQDCKRRGCVLDAIYVYSAVLARTSTQEYSMKKDNTKRGLYVNDRSKALMFLAHFVGDIHQPLHVSYADDRGGNQVKIKIASRKKSTDLHWVWDSYLVARSKKGEKKLLEELLLQVSSQDMSVYDGASPSDWAQESLRLTKEIYRTLPANKTLQESYYRNNHPIVAERIKIAGYRLGRLLNELLAEQGA